MSLISLILPWLVHTRPQIPCSVPFHSCWVAATPPPGLALSVLAGSLCHMCTGSPQSWPYCYPSLPVTWNCGNSDWKPGPHNVCSTYFFQLISFLRVQVRVPKPRGGQVPGHCVSVSSAGHLPSEPPGNLWQSPKPSGTFPPKEPAHPLFKKAWTCLKCISDSG